MLAHHPSEAAPPWNFWGGGEFGRGRRGAFGRCRLISLPPAPILRSAKGPAFRDIAPAKDSPSRRFQWAIYAHISELHPSWPKMGRKMRPLSAAPHQAICGQKAEEFPEYAIARRRDRDIRPMRRGVHRKRAPATHLTPVRLMISRCAGDGPANASHGEPPRFEICLPRGGHPLRQAGYFPGNAFTVDPPGNAFPVNFPENSMDAQPSPREIHREISRAIWTGEFPGRFPGCRDFPGNFPGNGCRSQKSWRRGGGLMVVFCHSVWRV